MKKKLAAPLLALGTAGVISFAAFARPLRCRGPDELNEKSDLVLMGIVTQVTDTGSTSTIRLASNPPLPVRNLRASVRVIEMIKGKAGRAVAVEYASLHWDEVGEKFRIIVNPPVRFRSEKARCTLCI